jgi:hypothetical protein
MSEAVRRDEEVARLSLIAQVGWRSGVSEEEAIASAIRIIEGATARGATEVLVYRFPLSLCSDRGQAIRRQEPRWEATLTGVAREIHDLWVKHFREQGYRLSARIMDGPNGTPDDVGMMLSWG